MVVVVVAFSSHTRNGEGGEIFDDQIPACTFFWLSGDQVEHTNSTLFNQDRSTVAQLAKTTVAERVP